MSSIRSIVVVAAALAALTACEVPPQVIDTPVITACEADSQCSAGTLCIFGECLIAQCNPGVESVCGVEVVDNRDPACCRPFQNCNTISFTCERDPQAVGIGCPPGEDDCIPCDENPDCVEALGFQSFCSAGRCFSQEGRTTCTQDFQCPGSERCDRTEFFCIPDAGACRFCGPDFPELCCQNGQVCDTESGSCLEIGDVECTEATVAQDCRLGELCDTLGRCVQCITTDDCGPNTECNPGTGLCDSTIGRCDDNSDCTRPFLCIQGGCAIPECERDAECGDFREICENFTCVLPPAVCTETDEPNNSPSAAVELATLGAGYAGTLCRGDQDFISFPIQAQKRYVVTVTIPSGNSPFSGLAVTLTDSSGAIESSGTFGGSPSLPLVGVSGPAESGRFTIAINTAGNTLRDQWAYTVSIREEEASAEPDCSAAAQAGQEPNENFAAALPLTLGQTTSFSRCGTADVDFFKVDVPALNGVEFTVGGFLNAEGNINVEVFRGPQTSDRVATGSSTANQELVTAPEGSTTYFARVFLGSPSGALNNQLYTISARALPRPAACDPDVGEDDGSTTTARALPTTIAGGLVSGSQAALRCNNQDTDVVSFTVPPNLGGTVRIAFTHSEGDLALELLDSAGAQIGATANSSSAANGAEAIDLPQSTTAQNYFARVRLNVSGTPITAQPYTLTLATFDAAQCLASEPTADGTFTTARCLGTGPFVSTIPCNGAALPLPLLGSFTACEQNPAGQGCFLTCGNADVDAYRLGELESGRTITVALAYAAADGALDVQIGRASGTALSPLSTVGDVDNDGLIVTNLVTSGAQTREYAVLIRPVGSAGHEAQLYGLEIRVSDACTPDAAEAGAGNNTPATANVLRQGDPADDDVRTGTMCVADIDVFKVTLLRNETVRATLTGVVGGRVSVGTPPANLNNPAVPLTPPVTTTAGADGIATVTFTAPSNGPFAQDFFLTVERGADAATGDYSFAVDYGNEAPELTSAATATAQQGATIVYTATATDGDATAPNNTMTFSLKAGVGDVADLAINATTGVVTLAGGGALDPATKASYAFTVVVTDGATPALSDELAVTVTVVPN